MSVTHKSVTYICDTYMSDTGWYSDIWRAFRNFLINTSNCFMCLYRKSVRIHDFASASELHMYVQIGQHPHYNSCLSWYWCLVFTQSLHDASAWCSRSASTTHTKACYRQLLSLSLQPSRFQCLVFIQSLRHYSLHRIHVTVTVTVMETQALHIQCHKACLRPMKRVS